MHVRLLGRLIVERDGNALALPRSRKTRALLAYLAATGKPQGRGWLCDLLWEGPADPRAALRWSLAKLRPLLDEDDRVRIVTEGDTVALELETAELDLARVEELVGPSPERAATGDLRAAAALFRGTLLEGLELDGCHRFDAWLSGRREELRRLRSAVLVELLGRLRDRPREALSVAMRRLAAEPYEERAYLDVAIILESLGRIEEAWEQLDRARVMLEEVLHAAPSDEHRALERRLASAAGSGSAPPARGSARTGVDRRGDVEAAEPTMGDDRTPAPELRLEMAAARHALRRGQPEEARPLVDEALGRVDALPRGERPAHRLSALELLVHPAMASHRPADLGRRLAEAIEEARRADRTDLARFGFYLVANLHYQDEDFEQALRDTLRAEGVGRLADPETVVRSLADTARCLGMLERHPARARRLAEEARTLAGAVDGPLLELEMAFGLLRRHQGRYGEALDHFARAVRTIRETENDWWESSCLLWTLMLHLERGRPADALVACGELRAAVWRREQAPEAALADGLGELARSGVEGAAPTPALDEAAAGLRSADSRWMLAYLQVGAAAAEQRAGRGEAAAGRAREALEAARSVGRQNEVALARARLACLAAEAGRTSAGLEHLKALPLDGVELEWLSARAEEALAAARSRLDA